MAKSTFAVAAWISIPLVLAAGLVAYRATHRPATAPTLQPQVIVGTPAVAAAATPPVVLSPGVALGPVPTHAPASEPGILAGWSTWQQTQREATLAQLVGAPAVDLDVLAFIRLQLDVRTLSPVTRNMLANVLVAQAPDAALAVRLQAMVIDPQESDTWRDYALQHLARVTGKATDPAATAAFIRGLVDTGTSSLPGTALLQVQRLESEGLWSNKADLDHAVIGLATAPTTALPNRMTAVALIGSRHLTDQTAFLRTVIAGPSEPALVRTAIASLGQVGTPSDIALLEPYLASKDGAVVLAAQAAVDRLRQASL